MFKFPEHQNFQKIFEKYINPEVRKAYKYIFGVILNISTEIINLIIERLYIGFLTSNFYTYLKLL
jgi:hypothetical protein